MVGGGVQMMMGSGVHIVGGSSWERENLWVQLIAKVNNPWSIC